MHASEQEREDVQAARRAWGEAQAVMDIEKLVFIDETWASTSMTRRYGRAPRGQRCIASAPHGHWQSTTFVAGLRHQQLTAPMVADGPMDGELFLAYVRQFLCPTLRPGDIVILDNLSSHKVAGVFRLTASPTASLVGQGSSSPLESGERCPGGLRASEGCTSGLRTRHAEPALGRHRLTATAYRA